MGFNVWFGCEYGYKLFTRQRFKLMEIYEDCSESSGLGWVDRDVDHLSLLGVRLQRLDGTGHLIGRATLGHLE